MFFLGLKGSWVTQLNVFVSSTQDGVLLISKEINNYYLTFLGVKFKIESNIP